MSKKIASTPHPASTKIDNIEENEQCSQNLYDRYLKIHDQLYGEFYLLYLNLPIYNISLYRQYSEFFTTCLNNKLQIIITRIYLELTRLITEHFRNRLRNGTNPIYKQIIRLYQKYSLKFIYLMNQEEYQSFNDSLPSWDAVQRINPIYSKLSEQERIAYKLRTNWVIIEQIRWRQLDYLVKYFEEPGCMCDVCRE